MTSLARRARAVVTIAALAAGGLAVAAPLASAAVTGPAAKVPFSDPYAHGWLTFCSRNDQPVTSGSLDTVPFSWKTISSAAPPPAYRSGKARVALYAYQPIQYVDPGDWSGTLLTAASAFSNAEHPVVQSTNADVPLVGFVEAYPPHWDGLEEIRMMYSAVDKAQLTTPYAVAVIRVTGSRWTLVEGGGGSCAAGQGLSMETVSLPKKDLAKQETATTGKPGSGASSAPSAGAPAAGGSSGGSGAAGSARLASADSSSGMSGGEVAGIAVGALAVVWAAIFLIARRRRAAS